MLIDPRRVEISDYFKTFRKDFKLAVSQNALEGVRRL